MTTILVTGLGGSIAIDVCRSLRRDRSLRLIGCDANPWGLRQAGHLVDEAIAVPRGDRDAVGFHAALAEIIDRQGVDFTFVNPDPELEALAALGRPLPGFTAMPPLPTVGISLDKARTVAACAAACADAFPATVALAGEADVDRAFAELGAPLWMRSAVGAGGRGSLVVGAADEALAWMRYWDRRGKGYQWVLQELLPGANVNWTGIYAAGRLVASAAMERLRYFLGNVTASGVSGQVSECATVDPEGYREVSARVVRALDAEPHGIYSVDLRHDREGRARVTEVNPRLAGRPWLYANSGANLALAAVRALLDQPLGDAIADGGLRPGVHLYRQLDIDPVIA
ncbi:MAG TPA: hypothetical protein VL172_09160 [Kofleriaceae bacterium]|nr:hypothetical protein [Kofleriaceae bacterium]